MIDSQGSFSTQVQGKKTELKVFNWLLGWHIMLTYFVKMSKIHNNIFVYMTAGQIS